MWSNKKYGKKLFKGYYKREQEGERVFVLIGSGLGTQRKITFESWQAAKALGWVNSK